MKSFLFFFLILFLSVANLASQENHVVDSLQEVLKTQPKSETQISCLIAIGDSYLHNIPDSSLKYFELALELSKKESSKVNIALCQRNIGSIYVNKSDYDLAKTYLNKSIKNYELIENDGGIALVYEKLGFVLYLQDDYDEALEYYKKALKINKKNDDNFNIPSNLGNIGLVYTTQGHYNKAINYYLEAVAFNEEFGNKANLAGNFGNIALIYINLENYDKALEYHDKSLKMFREIGNKYGIASNYLNMGGIFYYKEDYDKAAIFFKKALVLNEELGRKNQIAVSLSNLGIIYKHQGDFKKALSFYKKAISINNELGRKESVAFILMSISDLYNELGKYDDALYYSIKGLKIAEEINNPRTLSDLYISMAESYKGIKLFEESLKYTELWVQLKDSLFSIEKTTAIEEIQTQYETKKSKEQIKLQQAEISYEKTLRKQFLYASILMLFLVIFALWSYIQKKKANGVLKTQKSEIQEKNEELFQQSEELQLLNENLNQQNEEISAQRDEIEQQKDIVEGVHYEISQSIDYAKRLQTSILPEENLLRKYFSDIFILFNPKDKVSGDFYWWTHIENQTIITAADSTGHGVPGAFMSMLGISFLREIVQKEYITHPAVILRKLRKEIVKTLKQTGKSGTHKDGMDMALISINHETNILQFSGANNPLYIIKNKAFKIGYKDVRIHTIETSDFVLYEIKPDKMPIAIYDRMDKFKTHEIQLEKGDQLYMFSDGYPDQFGGPKGKKFKYKPFKRLLLENANKPLQEQKEILDNAFNTWKGMEEQIDDVVIVSIKV